MLKKLLLFFSSFVFLFLLFFSPVLAEGEFRTDIDVEYKIQQSGITTVSNTVTLQNLFSDLYATSYTLVLDNIKAINIEASQGNESLPVEIKEEGTKTNIIISFPDSLVGRGNKRIFNLSYDDATIAAKTGEVWEITIPRLSPDSSFSSYNLSFSIPLSFGQEAYLSPNPIRRAIKDGSRVYLFDKETVSKTGIVAGFGEFQVFSFNLIYHLENPLVKSASIEIALPPDTSLQKVYYESLIPEPNNVRVDEDGNWIATYILTPRQRVDITAKGSVQIFAGSRPFIIPTADNLTQNLLSTDYWQSSDPGIIELAKKYRTPKEIYDFVVGYLSYNFDRVKPNVVRLGALEALRDPTNAICMEFTDLFVAIARAAGIPAREINGFAYTENPKIQPLSLVSDVLHSWPEYWDKEKETWISVDPTWGSTTGGVDFFNKLDLRHFAFVIHGKDSQKPYPPGSYKLGPNPQKDVFVNFGQLPLNRIPNIQIVSEVEKFIPFSSQKIKVTIKNNGSSSAYNLTPSVYFDEREVISSDIKEIPILPSYGKTSFEVKVPFSFLGSKTPHFITVSAGDEKITIESAKSQVIIYNLASIFLVVLILTLLILVRLGKIKLENLKEKWNTLKFKNFYIFPRKKNM